MPHTRLLLALLPFFLQACSALPRHARPQVSAIDAPRTARSDAIPYRTMQRGDFLATKPPAQIGSHADRMAAYTCAAVIPKVPIPIRIAPDGRGFVARAPELEVNAWMDRSCSWWNESVRTVQTPAYILQHEQIHFALVEIAAREMQARGRALERHGATIQAAQAAFQRALDDLSRDSRNSIERRNTEFDEGTSGVHDPAAQQRWFDRVQAELAR